MKKRIIVSILSSLMILSSFSLNSKAEMKEEYIEYIEEVSSDYNICPELIESIIFYESSWNEKAYNSKSKKSTSKYR